MASISKQLSKIKPGDFILLAFFIITGLGLGYALLIQPQIQKTGNNLIISLDGRTIREQSLSNPGKFTIRENGISSIYVIKDGKVDVLHSNCPLKICVKSKPISKPGEMIICLPNKVVFFIQGNTVEEIDAATY